MFKNKYLKYKEKYLQLKNLKGAGRNNHERCPICLESFPPPPAGINQLNHMHLNTPQYRETMCCHNIFHAQCINGWMGRNDKCPMCNHRGIQFVDRHTHVTPLIKSKYEEVVVNRLREPLDRKEKINNQVNRAVGVLKKRVVTRRHIEEERRRAEEQRRRAEEERRRVEEQRRRAEEERRRAEEEERRGVEETRRTRLAGRHINIDLDFEWTDGSRSCLCCDGFSHEYELNISGDSLDTLRFRFKHTHSHLEQIANPVSDDMYDEGNYDMEVDVDENVYTRANMRDIIAEIRDMYIDDDDDVKDRMFAFFDTLPDLEANPQNWNAIMERFDDT